MNCKSHIAFPTHIHKCHNICIRRWNSSKVCLFLKLESDKSILKMSKLCHSLGGLEVPLVIVHETNKEKTESTANGDEETPMMKRCVIVCGRAHPGESNGSYMVEGFIDFICGDTKLAEFLRKHVIFKIVPMINPDGVSLGNYRTGLSGRDFNR